MSYCIDVSFAKGEPAKFVTDKGGLRMTGDDPDDVIDALCELLNRSIALVDSDSSVCRICAILDYDAATTHTTDEHGKE